MGYTIGKLLTEVALDIAKDAIIAAITAGVGLLNIFRKIAVYARKLIQGGAAKFVDSMNLDKVRKPKSTKERKVCLGIKGCFVENTPVLVFNKNYSDSYKINFKNTAKAMAACIPVVALPIQEVQLLDYAVVHETVNEQNNFVASTDEGLYLELLNESPYTSLEQLRRDKYELNDTDWYGVSFEQINGTSKCHFALHNDWINKQGYETEKVVVLSLPEQGINGLFRVTSIKHIIPQKKPNRDIGDGYNWKPVTALFEHYSNQVYDISFDNGEQLGVTYHHPIYSTTTGDWRLAGELNIGEEVLTISGNTKVIKSKKKEYAEIVYNLEVKEMHNFLVGNQGTVVHNSCASAGPCDWLWDVTHQYSNPATSNAGGWETAIEHIYYGHSHPIKKPGKSYFNELFDSESKLQDLVTEMTQDWAKYGKGEGTLVDLKDFGPNHRFLVDYASKPHLLDRNGFIGYVKDSSGNMVGTTMARVTLNKDFKVYNAFPSNTLQ